MVKRSDDEAYGMAEAPRIAPPIHAHANVNVEYESEDAMIVSTIRAFYRWLMPPPPHAKPEERHGWDKRLAVTVFSLTIVYLFSICAEYDFIPWLDGFARQSNITSLSEQIKTVQTNMTSANTSLATSLSFIQKQSIEQVIDAKLKLRCLANNGDERADLSSDIQHLEDRYYKITNGQGYPQPTCYELGVSNKP